MPQLRSVELFGGAGGLALGLHQAGFSSEVFVEWDKWACDTVRENARAGHSDVQHWSVRQGDVRAVDWSDVPAGIDLVSGGPPCQPFSMGGKARAADDKRDMFPAAAEVIRVLQPRAFILENVKGLTRSAFANYLQLVQLRLQHPQLPPHHDETWLDHLARLQSEHTGSARGLTYKTTLTVVNAADYGVPQQRHRVLIVGFRSDVDAEWAMPRATHSHDALLRDQWVSGEYWDEHRVGVKSRPSAPERLAGRIEKIRTGELEVNGERWRTVRDALADMPEPRLTGTRGWHNHVLQEGARSYPGHDGSPIDMPAKTLKAGGHGVPGGENMLRRVDGSIRYFSIRESARLQTFPDDYRLHGAWGEAMRQIGNAVPVRLAKVVGDSVATHLREAAPLLRLAQ
jgi:DNA (cytosine-5)-methyltransferase 1